MENKRISCAAAGGDTSHVVMPKSSPNWSVATTVEEPSAVRRFKKNKDSSSSNGSIELPPIETDASTLSAPAHWKYSRTHQKRFHRRFPTIDDNEQLIDWFACALLADILLQGYLYISQNYFAFYSNIFGYKTHILIPIEDVTAVSKEKTAKIFPNAVGICTKTHRYVFGSLFSRENTHKLLQEVWHAKLNCVKNIDENLNNDLELDKRQFTSLLNSDLKDDVSVITSEATELTSIGMSNSLLLPDGHEPVIRSSFALRLQMNKSHSLGSGGASSFFMWQNNAASHGNEFDRFQPKHLRRRRMHKSETDCSFAENPKVQKSTNWHKGGTLTRLRKSFQSWSNQSLRLFFVAIMSALLFVSAMLLLLKINEAHDKIRTLNPNSTMADKRFFVGQQINRVVSVLKTNLMEMDEIKSSLEKLLQRIDT